MDYDVEEAVKKYNEEGFVVIKVYSADEYKQIRGFALNWITSVIQPLSKKEVEHKDIQAYHKWFKDEKIDHGKIFVNENRVVEPNEVITKLIQNNALMRFVREITGNTFHVWRDPGVGWLCYRMIRPGFNDGYHLCKKSWGLADKVVSIWLPIIGFSSNETLQILPRSHLKEYKKKKDPKNKFVEPELHEPISIKDLIRPTLKEGELIVYHPDVLHSEDVADSTITRFNLEFRFNPSTEK